MKVLVTGGTGLVGSALESISQKYNKYDFLFISSKDCDLSSYEETFNFFKKHNKLALIN